MRVLKKLALLVPQIRKLYEQRNRLSLELESAQAESSALRTRIEALELEVVSLKSQRDTERTASGERVQSLEAELRDARTESIALHQEAELFERNILELGARVADIEHENSRLRDERDGLSQFRQQYELTRVPQPHSHVIRFSDLLSNSADEALGVGHKGGRTRPQRERKGDENAS